MKRLIHGLAPPALALSALLAACTPAAAPVSTLEKTVAAKSAATAAPAQLSPTALAAKPVAQLVPINVGVLGTTSDAPIFIALERGYFKEQGLDVKLTRFNTAIDMIAPLSSKQLDVGAGGINAALFNAVAQGIPLRMVADKNSTPADFKGSGWFVRAELADKVNTPSDLKGLTVALGSKCSVADTELAVLLKKGGLSRTDVSIKDVRYADQVAAFGNKSVDIAYTFEPFSTALESNGLARLWVTSGSVIPNHVQSVIIYGPSMVDRLEIARGWMIAYVMGARDAIKAFSSLPLDDEVTGIMLKHGNEKDPEKVRTSRPSPLNPDVAIYLESVQTDLAFFKEAGCVEKAPDVRQVVDNTYAEYAVSKLGKFKP